MGSTYFEGPLALEIKPDEALIHSALEVNASETQTTFGIVENGNLFQNQTSEAFTTGMPFNPTPLTFLPTPTFAPAMGALAMVMM